MELSRERLVSYQEQLKEGHCQPEMTSDWEKALSVLDTVKVVVKLLGDKPLIWEVTEWLKLQKERICGSLIGTPPHLAQQTNENSLPLLLMPEEVSLILELGIGTVVSYRPERKFPSEGVKRKYQEYLTTNSTQQVDYYTKLCRQQVLERIDSILEGKRRKQRQREEGAAATDREQSSTDPAQDRQALIEAEVARKVSAATAHHLVHIPTASPWLTDEDLQPAAWNYPTTPLQCLRYRVYKDLYQKGYYLTPGVKFGGHFLVYPGEPWKFHAYWIVVCTAWEEEIPLEQLVSHCRLGVATRKGLVLASVDPASDTIQYSTVSWPQ